MQEIAKRGAKLNRRLDIIRAAEKLMQTRGLSGVTTRLIAQEVGCSEGALYVHFKGRLELLLAMLEESLPDMLGPLRVLQESVGQGSVHKNLERALTGIYRFHQKVILRTAGLFAEPELLAAYRNSLRKQGKGPHLSLQIVEAYIRSEQRLKRVATSVDAKWAASLLMASSFFRAFSESFFGKPVQPAWGRFVKQLVLTVAPKADTGAKPE